MCFNIIMVQFGERKLVNILSILQRQKAASYYVILEASVQYSMQRTTILKGSIHSWKAYFLINTNRRYRFLLLFNKTFICQCNISHRTMCTAPQYERYCLYCIDLLLYCTTPTVLLSSFVLTFFYLYFSGKLKIIWPLQNPSKRTLLHKTGHSLWHFMMDQQAYFLQWTKIIFKI